MSRVRDILKDCQIYSGGLNITGDVTEKIVAALEAVEEPMGSSDIGFDLNTVCNHMDTVRNGSVRQSWKNIRNRLYKLDEKVRGIPSLVRRLVIEDCRDCGDWGPADSYGCGTVCGFTSDYRQVQAPKDTSDSVPIPEWCPRLGGQGVKNASDVPHSPRANCTSPKDHDCTHQIFHQVECNSNRRCQYKKLSKVE